MERKSVAVLEKVNGFKNGGFLFDISLKCSHCGENIHVSDADYFDVNFENIARCSACNQDTVIDYHEIKPILDDCISDYENHTFLITDNINYNFVSRLAPNRKIAEKVLLNELNAHWHIVEDNKIVLNEINKQLKNIESLYISFDNDQIRNELEKEVQNLKNFKMYLLAERLKQLKNIKFTSIRAAKTNRKLFKLLDIEHSLDYSLFIVNNFPEREQEELEFLNNLVADCLKDY